MKIKWIEMDRFFDVREALALARELVAQPSVRTVKVFMDDAKAVKGRYVVMVLTKEAK